MVPLDEDLVKRARQMHQSGQTYDEIALELQTSYSALRQAIRGNTWNTSGKTLDDDLVCKARSLVREGKSYLEAAQILDTPYHALRFAVRGDTWRHLDEIEAPIQSRYSKKP